MFYGLLALSVVANLFGGSILRNKYCKEEIVTKTDLHLFNALSSAVSTFSLFVVTYMLGTMRPASLYTVLLGVGFGVITALCAIFSMKALAIGPLSYTSVITSCSMIIPALSGAVLFSEKVNILQYIGVALIIVSSVCAVDKKNDRLGASLKWLLFCLAAFVFGGGVGVMQKIHQSSQYKGELSSFLMIAFATSCVLSLVCALFEKRIKKCNATVLTKEKHIKFAIYGFACGSLISYCNEVNLFLSGVMPSIVFFPVVNGAGLLLSLLVGIVWFCERPSVRQWIGLAVGAGAMVLIIL